MPPQPSPATSKAFTLLELIIATAVIGLVMGIALPVLARARRAARSVQSLSNLRQLGQMTELYQDDHKRLFPKPAEGTFRGNGDLDADRRVQVLWYNALDPYAGLAPPATLADREKRNDVAWKQAPAWADIPSSRQAANRTFKMNAYFADDAEGRYQTHGHLVRQPARTVVYGDGQAEDMAGQSSIGNASSFAMTEGIVGPRNPGRSVHVCCADGHASAEYQPLKERDGSKIYPCPGWYSENDKKGGQDRTLIWNFVKAR